MIIDDDHYDVIVIGSGAAGGTVAAALAAMGRSVLILERGGSLPQEDQNVADIDLFRKDRYHPAEQWFGTDGDPFNPQAIYALGGNTKIWGAVLERMRAAEFDGLAMQTGRAPAWGLDYADFAPWYDRAEALYRVHGAAGIDPTEPERTGAYPHPPRPIEPFLEPLRSGLERQGCRPYDLPLTWSEDLADPTGDAELFGVIPALEQSATRLRTQARVRRLHVNPSGTEVRGVEADIKGQRWLFRADQVVLAAGAINTPAILLASASDPHPDGLANGSGLVGRHLMKLQLSAILQRASEPNSGRYPRSLGINDYYWGDKNVSFPLGHIESGGGVLQDPLFAESPPVLSLVSRLLPKAGLERLAARSVCWWATSAVLPDPDNRITLRNDRIRIHYLPNNLEAHDRLVYRWLDTLQAVEADPLVTVVNRSWIHPRGEAPLAVMGYACGTCRMGSDPSSSVVDLQGRCHGIGNLTIADASVFPSCPGLSPGLTIIANALRLAEHLA
ncbi:GMC family oxidoreductase [Synechococcus sp. CS-1325]|uniref:GMC oxidoreductase n=1 Tax=Synechococcus sp. CS-1325 TaxID=2847979 RepID=UPI000DB41C55|nr:GMC family oxidoreductase [Synechococcus sp. CS-1325]MCT0200837.1 GMC family oxidoreductase [Synechococcus sp. CS-1325]PZV00250.1 MAG: dehydrogenase [Cyanobium sp.]